jgi:hypothetical protein
MKLFGYRMSRDYGFAPNPFYGWCTLATCKPRIRKSAEVGDWVFGIGGRATGCYEKLMFAMLVDEIMSFNSYWDDPRFKCKKPVLNGSTKQRYGDNIYHKEAGNWIQEDSHHSFEEGVMNTRNLAQDTQTNRVLLSKNYVYYGAEAIGIPTQFRCFGEDHYDICNTGRDFKKNYPEDLVIVFHQWLATQCELGLQGWPVKM